MTAYINPSGWGRDISPVDRTPLGSPCRVYCDWYTYRMKIMVYAQGGGLRKSYNKMAQDEYCRRLEHYCEVNVVDVASRQLANYARFEEGARVLLDSRGQEITSRDFSERLQNLMNMGTRKLFNSSSEAPRDSIQLYSPTLNKVWEPALSQWAQAFSRWES